MPGNHDLLREGGMWERLEADENRPANGRPAVARRAPSHQFSRTAFIQIIDILKYYRVVRKNTSNKWHCGWHLLSMANSSAMPSF